MRITNRAIRRTLLRLVGETSTRSLGKLLDVRSSLEYRFDQRGRDSAGRLEEMRGQYRGRRCFILGNGPSLRDTDLELLRNEYTFGLNRIYLLFDKIGFETSFLVTVNRHVIEQSPAELMEASSTKFVSWRARALLPERSDVTFLRSVRGPLFSTDPVREGVWEGGTVTFVAMQLAYYLGFEQAILLGVDHTFATQGPPNQLVTSTGDDPNHFDPNYFGAGYRWQLPDLETSEYAYRLARRQFEAAGREIIDATVGGKLTVFRKIPYEDAFSN